MDPWLCGLRCQYGPGFWGLSSSGAKCGAPHFAPLLLKRHIVLLHPGESRRREGRWELTQSFAAALDGKNIKYSGEPAPGSTFRLNLFSLGLLCLLYRFH